MIKKTFKVIGTILRILSIYLIGWILLLLLYEELSPYFEAEQMFLAIPAIFMLSMLVIWLYIVKTRTDKNTEWLVERNFDLDVAYNILVVANSRLTIQIEKLRELTNRPAEKFKVADEVEVKYGSNKKRGKVTEVVVKTQVIKYKVAGCGTKRYLADEMKLIKEMK